MPKSTTKDMRITVRDGDVLTVERVGRGALLIHVATPRGGELEWNGIRVPRKVVAVLARLAGEVADE